MVGYLEFFQEVPGPWTRVRCRPLVHALEKDHLQNNQLPYPTIWGFPKIRGTILGVLMIIRIVVFWCLYWGPLIWGNYHIPPMYRQ